MGFWNMKKLTWRAWMAANLVLALIFINLLVFGPALRMGESFTAGLLSGVGAGWLIFAVSGAFAIRRGDRGFDERRRAAFTAAAALAFWAILLATNLSVILLRSESLGIHLEAKELALLLGNLGLATFGISWLVIERRS